MSHHDEDLRSAAALREEHLRRKPPGSESAAQGQETPADTGLRARVADDDPAAAPESPAASTFAWLIEAGPDAGGAYWWWASPGWVTDALLATRYATKDEADAAAAESNLSARTVEHGFMGSDDAAR